MFLSGNKKDCAYTSSPLKEQLYIVCIIFRILLALLFLYFLINDSLIQNYYWIIIILFGTLLLSFVYKYKLCGITNWKNYTKTIIIYSIIFILLCLLHKFDTRMHYIYLVISILIILDVLFGVQTKFNAFKYQNKK
jgi:small basic protein